jgi:hypothetical protein
MRENNVNIVAHVGRSFEVTLYASPGTTGYSWILTGLPPAVGLTDVSLTPVAPIQPGSVSRQIFTFLGLAVGGGALSFDLVRPWEPDKPADKRNYTVEVLSEVAEAASAMQAVAGNESFPSVVFGVCEGEHKGKIMVDSRTNCVQPYGFPDGIWPANVKYGFPVIHIYGGFPPAGFDTCPSAVILYAVNPPRE